MTAPAISRAYCTPNASLTWVMPTVTFIVDSEVETRNGQEEIVPGADEGDDGERRRHAPVHRQVDAEEDVELVHAVDAENPSARCRRTACRR